MNSFRGFKHLEIGGALRPFHIGTHQTEIFCGLKADALYKRAKTDEEREKYSYPIEPEDYSEIFFNKDEAKIHKVGLKGENWLLLIYSALLAGYELSDAEPDFKLVHLKAWLDEPEWKAQRGLEFINFFYGAVTENIRELNRLLEEMNLKKLSA